MLIQPGAKSETARRLMAERAEERISPKNPEKAAKYAAAQAQATQAAPAASTPAVPAERVATAEKAATERIAAAEKAAAEQKAQFMTFQIRILDENLKLEQEHSEYKSTIHYKNKKAGHREKQFEGADEYAEEANDRAFATAKQLT